MPNFKDDKGRWIGMFQLGDIVNVENSKYPGKITRCAGWLNDFHGYAYVVNYLNNDLEMLEDCFGHYSEFQLSHYTGVIQK